MGNVICIYDAENDTNLSQESRYMMMSEIASAGVVVVSKLNEEDVKRKDEILSRIESFMDEFDCSRVIRSEDIIMKNWQIPIITRLSLRDIRKPIIQSACI